VKLSLVAAVARNGVIGRDGALPWRLPRDLARLKRLTTGHCVLMGRRTWESIGRPLPERTNIVITRDARFAPAGAVVAHGVEAAIAEARARGETEAFVLGGEAIYAAALPLADRLYLTRVHADVPGDVRFPSLEAVDARRGWRLVREEHHPADARHAHAFTFQDWERG
jgi:dihydrofolate reductase